MQSAEHDDRRGTRRRRQIQRRFLVAHQRNQLVIDDLDRLLARRDALEDILADALGPDLADEAFRHLLVDIR